jgi:hypothetical protein
VNHPVSPMRLSDQVAEAVRALDRSMLQAGGMGPGDLHYTAMTLERVAYGLAQVLGSLRGQLAELDAAGRLRTGAGADDLAERLQQARAYLANATASADALGLSLGHAATHLGQLTD